MNQSVSKSVSTRTIQKTGADGKVHTVTITETKTVIDGKEEIVTTTSESEGPTIQKQQVKNSPTEKPQQNHEQENCGFFGRIFGKKPEATKAPANTSNNDATSSPQDVKEFRAEALKVHNNLRKRHGVPQLKESKELHDFAQEWANELASTGNFRHRPNVQYGENIFFAMKPGGNVTAKDAVESWYSEIKDCNFKTPGGVACGHFTQVVWKSSSELGIGMARSGDKTFVVANYNPPGNVHGQYSQNVMPAK